MIIAFEFNQLASLNNAVVFSLRYTYEIALAFLKLPVTSPPKRRDECPFSLFTYVHIWDTAILFSWQKTKFSFLPPFPQTIVHLPEIMNNVFLSTSSLLKLTLLKMVCKADSFTCKSYFNQDYQLPVLNIYNQNSLKMTSHDIF